MIVEDSFIYDFADCSASKTAHAAADKAGDERTNQATGSNPNRPEGCADNSTSACPC
jgi:hypothetical protein